jgi:hypothetical protein
MTNVLPSLMVPCKPAAKLMVSSPEAIPARKELGPLSLRFMTVNVLGNVRSSNRKSWGRKRGLRFAAPRAEDRDDFIRKFANMESLLEVGKNLCGAAALRVQGNSCPFSVFFGPLKRVTTNHSAAITSC